MALKHGSDPLRRSARRLLVTQAERRAVASTLEPTGRQTLSGLDGPSGSR